MRQAERVRRELILGIVIWMVPVMLLLVLLTPASRLAAAAGVLAGSAGAAGIVCHMYRSLDAALDLPPKQARTKAQLAALERTFLMGVLIVAAMLLPEYIHPAGVIFGLFGVKVSALMYPVLHKQAEKYRLKKKKRPARISSGTTPAQK
ncbi:MAG: ATP synthase subunit I [Clostridiaceae bacterium]|nr:ATP synthase subunit I [Clostridiaceae bacterium]